MWQTPRSKRLPAVMSEAEKTPTELIHAIVQSWNGNSFLRSGRSMEDHVALLTRDLSKAHESEHAILQILRPQLNNSEWELLPGWISGTPSWKEPDIGETIPTKPCRYDFFYRFIPGV